MIPTIVNRVALADADDGLEPAVVAMQCSSGTGTMVVCSPWSDMPLVSLLPFHLHLRWADRVPWLSLNARFTFLPSVAESVAAVPMYPALEAQKWRQQSRARRHTAGGQANDFASADWERAVLKHREEMDGVLLSGRAFVGVDNVTRDGDIRRGSRGALGRWAPSDLARPQILTTTRGDLSAAQAAVLADVDLLMIDLQGLHGRAARKGLDEVLRQRGAKPTVLFASCPSDLDGSEILSGATESCLTGPLPRRPTFLIQAVGKDRALQERNIDFALERDEHPASADFHVLARLARHAWWALRQALSPPNGTTSELESFRRCLALLGQRSRDLYFELADASRVLDEAAKRTDLAAERRAAVLSRILARNVRDTAVLTRDDTQASFLREFLASDLGVAVSDLPQLGVYVRPHYWRRNAYRCETCILTGYFGPRSLDAALRCQPGNITLIVDQIEQRAAWFALRRQTEILAQFRGLSAMTSRLRDIGNDLGADLTGLLDSASVTMKAANLAFAGDPFSASTANFSVPAGTLQIVFTDGSSVLTSEGSRFDVYGRRGAAIHAKSARELEPGDELIVTNSTTQARFSDMILERLDASVLKADVRRRAEWLHLVHSFAIASGLTPTVIVQRLAALGHDVDRASARSWTSKAEDLEPAVPSRYSTFVALAQVLNMPHSDTQLRELYLSARRVRTVHRLAGRALARAIRLAHLGVLDAPSQQRLQRQWGIQAHELQDAARIATVDQVLG